MKQFLSKIQSFFQKYRKATLIITVLAIVLPEVTVYFHRPARGGDMHGYVQAGNDALKLNDLYRDSAPSKNNTWPPFFSFFIMPLALSEKYLGRPITKELWYLFNFLCLLWTIKLWTLFLLDQKPKFISDHHIDFTSPSVFMPVLFIIPAIINNFFHLQINTFILFLVTLGLYYVRSERSLLAGTMLGLAASIKAFPGLFLLYYLIRRQWRIAGWICLMGLLFTLSPVFFYGIDSYVELMKRWLSISLIDKFVVGSGRYNYQSLYAMWEYYLAYHLKITEPASLLIRSATKVSVLLLFISSLFVFLKKEYDKNSITALMEYSLICVLMILFSPIAWRHYWVYVYPASATVFIYLKNNPKLYQKRAIRFLMIAWIALLLVPYISGSHIRSFIRTFSNFTFSAILLNILLLILHYRYNYSDKSRT